LEFGHAGAIIGLGDILSEKSAEQKMQLLSKAGVQAKYTKVDVSNSDQVKDWLQDLEKSYGAISKFAILRLHKELLAFRYCSSKKLFACVLSIRKQS
jgi:hypothetical protein